jgi:ABC-type multidrug transport system fused ATPase/permease subunit
VSGSITVDGVDIMQMGLQRLRQSIAVIPQHPLLLEGTLAANLDPFGRYPIAKLLDVLRTVGFNKTTAGGTDTSRGGDSSEGGSDGGNSSSDDTSTSAQLAEQLQRETGCLSAGQRQLISFARVLLKEDETRLVVMDEPTSNIDSATDKHIQSVARSRFRQATVLTIAHRLNSILHSDRILVLGDGKILQFGTPVELLGDAGGHLAQMAKHI